MGVFNATEKGQHSCSQHSVELREEGHQAAVKAETCYVQPASTPVAADIEGVNTSLPEAAPATVFDRSGVVISAPSAQKPTTTQPTTKCVAGIDFKTEMPITAQESTAWLVQNVLVKGRTAGHAQRNITFLQCSQGEAFWGELGPKLRVSNALCHVKFMSGHKASVGLPRQQVCACMQMCANLYIQVCKCNYC